MIGTWVTMCLRFSLGLRASQFVGLVEMRPLKLDADLWRLLREVLEQTLQKCVRLGCLAP